MSGSYNKGGRPPSRPPGYPGGRDDLPGPHDPHDYGRGSSPYGGQPAFAEPELPGYEPFYDDAPDPTFANPRQARSPLQQQPTTARPVPPAVDDVYPDKRRVREAGNSAIVPPSSVTGRSLVVVIAIMCFLACLTAGTVYMINRSADVWLKDMAGEVTLQVEPREGADTERTVADVAALLSRTAGIAAVRVMSLQDSTALLEPWLGQTEVLKTLPIPRLIAVEMDPASPPDLEQLRSRLASSFKGVSIDDHRHWQRQIRTVTRSLALGGFVILALVALATIAIIVSATRSAMASNSDIVEVLHFVGATDRFIAREFDKHFLKLGIKAGLVGASAAAFMFVTAPTVVNLIGGQGVTSFEIQRLVGSGSLDLMGYGMLVLVVIVIAALCMITSRLGVFNILNTRV